MRALQGFFILLMSLFLTACLGSDGSDSLAGSTPGETEELKPMFTEDDVIAKAQEMTIQNFYDPESALFRDLVLVSFRSSEKSDANFYYRGFFTDAEHYYVCGQVNGKNRFGAYVGYKSFNARVMFYTSSDKLDGFGMTDPGWSSFLYDLYKIGADACRDAI